MTSKKSEQDRFPGLTRALTDGFIEKPEQTPMVVDVAVLEYDIQQLFDESIQLDAVGDIVSRERNIAAVSCLESAKSASRPDEAPALRAEVARLKSILDDKERELREATRLAGEHRAEAAKHDDMANRYIAERDAERRAHDATRKVCREVAKDLEDTAKYVPFTAADVEEHIAALRQAGGAE
jgi:hypothetical protein